MRVYVATKYELKDRAREEMLRLSRAGHSITYDWTLPEPPTVEQAILDLRGVLDADVVVFIFEEERKYAGSLVELGIALGAGKPVYIIGYALDGHCIFLQHPNVRRETEYRRDVLKLP